MNTNCIPTKLAVMAIGLLAGNSYAEVSGPHATPEASLVARQVEAYNARNLDAFLATYGPNAMLFDLDTGKRIASGTDELRKRYTHRFTSSPDLHATIHQRIALDNYVIDRESVIKKKGEPRSEAIAIYYVREKLIQGVWFLFFDEATAKPTKGTLATVEKVFETMNTQDVGRILDLFAVDVEIRTLPENIVAVDGHAPLSDNLTRSFNFDQGIQMAISEKMGAGDFVVVHEQIEGSTGPQFEDLVVFDIKNGKVKRKWALRSN